MSGYYQHGCLLDSSFIMIYICVKRSNRVALQQRGTICVLFFLLITYLFFKALIVGLLINLKCAEF